MFTIAEREPDFPWPVVVKYPDPEHPGSFKESGRLTVFFKGFSTEELKLLFEPDGEEKQGKSGLGLLGHILAGWGPDLQAVDGQPLSFTPENLERLCRNPRVKAALYEAWTQALAGREERRLGN